MIYKLGTVKDMSKLPYTDSMVLRLIQKDLTILDVNYGSDRDIDNDDGGYVLYCTPGTRKETLKEVFDYTQHTPEFVNLEFCYCHAVYVLNNEYTVSILMYIEDAPKEIRYEI